MAKITPEYMCRSGTEHGEQAALFCWINSAETRRRFPQLYREADGKPKIYAAYNNAGSTGDATANAIRGAQAKAAGLQSGVPDTFLRLARHGKHGLYIELKVHPGRAKAAGRKPGKLSPEQELFRDDCRADGFAWMVAYGWEEAVSGIVAYLS